MESNFSRIDHSPAVYWFWHNIPDDDEIKNQVQNMFDSGIRTFLIQARLAFPREKYLSEEYFQAYRQAMGEAKKRGMHAGIYDEYNWCSGHAGGRTVALNDQARERHLFWTTGVIQNGSCACDISNIRSLMYSCMGDAVLDWIYEGSKPEWDRWQIFKVLACPQVGQEFTQDGAVDITKFCSVTRTGTSGCRVNVSLPENTHLDGYRVIAFANATCITSRLINYLSGEAVDAYIEAGYEPYKQHLREFFGDPIQYIFFDHPYSGFYDWQERTGNLGNSLMFSDVLPYLFARKNGYPLEIALLSFLLAPDPLTPRYRSDFFETYGDFGRKTFFGRISDWAKSNGLGLSGHELLAHVGTLSLTEGFPFLDARTNFAVDYFDIDSYRTQTAVDACNLEPQISAKMGDSVAKANGRRGCLIEQYFTATTEGVPGGAGQWGLTLDQLRSQAIRHTLSGASQFIFHGYYQTDGCDKNHALYKNPRFDFAPGINFEPWFTRYPMFASELDALATLMEKSDSKPQVAILYPMRTWWVEGLQHCFAGESEQWFRYLLSKHIPFDVICEDQLLTARIENGQILVGKDTYRALIFPGISTIKSRQTLEQVKRFTNGEGVFAASGCLPHASQELGEDSEIFSGFEKICLESERAFHIPQLLPAKNPLDEFFIKNIPEWVRVDSELSIWSWQGEYEGNPLVVLFNENSTDAKARIEIAKNTLEPYLMDLKTGQIRAWPWYETTEQGMIVHKTLLPKQMTVLLFRQKAGEENHLVYANCMVDDLVRANDGTTRLRIKPGGENPVNLTIYSKNEPRLFNVDSRQRINSIRMGENLWKIELDPLEDGKKSYLKEWHIRQPGQADEAPINLAQGWETQGWPDYSGEGIYHASFELSDFAQGMEFDLVLPRVETTADVLVNQIPIGVAAWEPYRFRLPFDAVKPGKNDLVVKVLNTGANHYYRNTPFQPEGLKPSGLIGYPYLEGYRLLEIDF